MYMIIEDCKTKEEALKKSGLYVGRPARISRVYATGNTNGTWTVHTDYEIAPQLLRQNICIEG